MSGRRKRALAAMFRSVTGRPPYRGELRWLKGEYRRWVALGRPERQTGAIVYSEISEPEEVSGD